MFFKFCFALAGICGHHVWLPFCLRWTANTFYWYSMRKCMYESRMFFPEDEKVEKVNCYIAVKLVISFASFFHVVHCATCRIFCKNYWPSNWFLMQKSTFLLLSCFRFLTSSLTVLLKPSYESLKINIRVTQN